MRSMALLWISIPSPVWTHWPYHVVVAVCCSPHWAQHGMDAFCWTSLTDLITGWKRDVVLPSLSSARGGDIMLYFPHWAEHGVEALCCTSLIELSTAWSMMLYFPCWAQHKVEAWCCTFVIELSRGEGVMLNFPYWLEFNTVWRVI